MSILEIELNVKLPSIQDIFSFMMVLVLFQLIFLNKTKSTSCRDLSPNRPFQELFLQSESSDKENREENEGNFVKN